MNVLFMEMEKVGERRAEPESLPPFDMGKVSKVVSQYTFLSDQ